MNGPTREQHSEMRELLQQAHAWIDTMQIAGIEEKVIVPAIHTALVERYLRAGGVEATVKWLEGQAQMTRDLGPALLEEIRKQGR